MRPLNKNFGIHEVVMWTAKCTRCEKLFQEGDLIAMTDQDALKDMLRVNGWFIGGDYYDKYHPANCWCPDCFGFNKDESVYVKH